MQDICPDLAQMKDTAIPVMTSAISAADLSATQPTIASIRYCTASRTLQVH